MVNVGDVVRIRADKANEYIQPYRDWAKKGREALVTKVEDDYARVVFACKRTPKRPSDYRIHIQLKNLDIVHSLRGF